jgi:hypothetical protein
MRRRAVIGGALLLMLLLPSCGEQPKPDAAPTTVTGAVPTETTQGSLTVIVETEPPSPPPPPAPPTAPAHLPDEFLLVGRYGEIVSVDGKHLGKISGAGSPNVNAFSGGDQSWTFRNGTIVRAKPEVFKHRLPGVSRQCRALARVETGTLFSCLTGDESLLLRTTSGNVLALVPPPPHSTGGHWRFAFPSPDGSRLLLYWSGECESPTAFFASAQGGDATSADGAGDWRGRPESAALGWTADGRALVLFGPGACAGGTQPAGVYAVDGHGTNTLIVKTRTAGFFHR